MGGDGSGRSTSRSKAWDAFDFMETTLLILERHFSDPEAEPENASIINAHWIEGKMGELLRVKGEFKKAVERERRK